MVDVPSLVTRYKSEIDSGWGAASCQDLPSVDTDHLSACAFSVHRLADGKPIVIALQQKTTDFMATNGRS